MAKTKTFTTSIDIPEETRQKMVALCNQQLADGSDLFSQTKQAHWSVKGPEFIALHLLFDEIAEELEDHVDTMAERITALGGEALGTVRMAAANSRLPEWDGANKALDVVKSLVERFAVYAKSSRAAIDAADEMMDRDTADLFTQISRDVDKRLWFLEAHLQG